MKTLVENYLIFSKTFVKKYKNELAESNVSILTDYLQNELYIRRFYKSFIEPNKPKIVLCGINPGRKGAGKTGVSFLDNKSLSKIFPEIENADYEKSGSFIYSVIEEFGVEKFYENIYVTNISCVGFQNSRTGNNMNYYQISPKIQKDLFDNFIQEMNIVQPDIIIPLSEWVSWDLKELKKNGRLNFEIGERLNHPAYSKVRKEDYISRLNTLIEKYGTESAPTLASQ